MAMRKVVLTELSLPVRSFLARVRKGRGLLVEDARGRARYGIISYEEAPRKEQAAAMKRLDRLHRKVAKVMREKGKTEEELDRILQKAPGHG